MSRRFYTSRKRAYRTRRDALAGCFAAAHDFVLGLELLCEGEHGFHMGTAQHVQFYFGEQFLFHLSIRDSTTEAPWLELSPRHHGRLKEGTHDAAHLLFRERIARVVQQLNVPASAVMRREEAYRIATGAPLAFFRLLQGELFDIAARSDDQPWQQEMFAGVRRRKKNRRQKKDPRLTLLAHAYDAEENIASLVRELEAEVGAAVTVTLDAEGGEVKVAERAVAVRAESLVEALAAVFEALDTPANVDKPSHPVGADE